MIKHVDIYNLRCRMNGQLVPGLLGFCVGVMRGNDTLGVTSEMG